MIDNTFYSRKYDTKIITNQNNRQLDLLLSFVWNESLSGEIWKEIEGLDSRYFISNYGRVLSLCCNGYKLLKPFICSDGYLYVDLRHNNEDIKSRVHRLVAEAFIPNIENKPIVHHIDCNKLNNKATNLLFLTYEEHNKIHRDNKRNIC